MIRAIVVVKLPKKVAHKPDLAPLPASRFSRLAGPSWRQPQELRSSALAEVSPANDGRLRPANIQGFQILQWRSLPIHLGVRLPYFKSLGHKSPIAHENGVSPHRKAAAGGSNHCHPA